MYKARRLVIFFALAAVTLWPVLQTAKVKAACELPAQQQLAAAQARMSGEKTYEFPIEKYYNLGTITVEFYIRAREVMAYPGFSVTNHDYPFPNYSADARPQLVARYNDAFEIPGLFLQGDSREADLNFLPEKSRVFAVLDFRAGKGYMVINKSTSKLRTVVTTHKSWDARPASREWGRGNSWFWADWVNTNQFRLRTHLMESAFGSSWLGAPSIDADIRIHKDTREVTIAGDGFPSIGVHQPTNCRTLRLRGEGSPMSLYDYESSNDLGPGPQNMKPGPAPVYGPYPSPNVNPTASFTWSRRPGAGNKVFFDSTGSRDADGNIERREWWIGSTKLGEGTTPTFSLGAGTSKSVTLKVFDNRGGMGSTIKTLSLPNREPVITGTNPVDGQTVGSNTPLLNIIAQDDDGENLSLHYRVTGPYVDISSGWVSGNWTVPEHKLDPGTEYTLTSSARDGTTTTNKTTKFRIAMLPTASDIITTPSGMGYWQVATDGGVFAYGDAQFHGSLPGLDIHVTNIMGIARTPSGQGYWLVGSDGGVFAFGDAPYRGSLPGLNIGVNNIVGMAPAKDGNGYWLVGSDGGVFAFGSAGFYGSMGGQHLNKPVVAMSATPTGNGYWLAAEDGGVFAYGDAPFYGSMGGQPLNAPVTDIDSTPDGKGYWMTAQDGGVFAYGNAGFHGSMAGKPLNGHITGMSRTIDGGGYWLTGCDGGIFAFGNAVFVGSQPRYGCRGF